MTLLALHNLDYKVLMFLRTHLHFATVHWIRERGEPSLSAELHELRLLGKGYLTVSHRLLPLLLGLGHIRHEKSDVIGYFDQETHEAKGQ